MAVLACLFRQFASPRSRRTLVGLRAVGVLAIEAAAHSAAAQTARTIADVPDCRKCDISVIRVVSLGKASDPELITNRPTVQRGNDGRVFVAGGSRPSTAVW